MSARNHAREPLNATQTHILSALRTATENGLSLSVHDLTGRLAIRRVVLDETTVSKYLPALVERGLIARNEGERQYTYRAAGMSPSRGRGRY